jgi:hypothetical protein
MVGNDRRDAWWATPKRCSDIGPSVGVNTRMTKTDALRIWRPDVPRGGQQPRKNLLQRPTCSENFDRGRGGFESDHVTKTLYLTHVSGLDRNLLEPKKGLEPLTPRLRSGCSTIELLRLGNNYFIKPISLSNAPRDSDSGISTYQFSVVELSAWRKMAAIVEGFTPNVYRLDANERRKQCQPSTPESIRIDSSSLNLWSSSCSCW